MSELRNRAVKSLAWVGGAQVIRQGTVFLVGVILSRKLGPQAFGLIGMILSVTGFASLFADMGLGAAIIQRRDLEPRHLNAVFWINSSIGVFLSILVSLLAPVLAWFFGEDRLILLTCASAATFTISGLCVVQNAQLSRSMNFRRLAKLEVSEALIGGATGLGCAYYGLGVWSLVWQTVVGRLYFCVAVWMSSDWRPQKTFEFAAVRELWDFSSGLFGFNTVNYWARNADKVLIGKYLGPESLGYYTRAYSLMLLPVTQITQVCSRVMFPSLSSIQGDLERVKRVYLRANRLIATATFPLMAGLFVVADLFFGVLLGSRWQPAVPIFKVLCLVGCFQSVSSTVGWIYQSLGRTDLHFKWALVATGIRVGSFAIGLQWGAIGVAWGYLLGGNLLLWYPSWRIAGGLIHTRFGELLVNLWRPTFASVGMALIVHLLHGPMTGMMSSELALICLGIAGVLSYGLLAFTLDPELSVEVKKIMSSLKKSRKPIREATVTP